LDHKIAWHENLGNAIPGDANLDGIVNGADYAIWADHSRPDDAPRMRPDGRACVRKNGGATGKGGRRARCAPRDL